MDRMKRIYARNCEVRRIGKEAAWPFLEANHRLGGTRCRYFYGLFHSSGGGPEELVAVSGFSSPRKWNKGGRTVRSCEWVRYASARSTRVDGGMGKTLKAFIDEVEPDDVMSYADASWSDGDAYQKLGFREEGAKEFPDGRKSLKFRLKLTDYEQ